MAVLTTVAEAKAQYLANCIWTGNTARMEAAYEAIVFLKLNKAKVLQSGGSQVEFEALEADFEKLSGALGMNAAAKGGGRRCGFRAMRSGRS